MRSEKSKRSGSPENSAFANKGTARSVEPPLQNGRFRAFLRLNISANGLNDESIALLASLINLEVLDLSSNEHLSDSIYPTLATLPHLRKLNLEYTGTSRGIVVPKIAGSISRRKIIKQIIPPYKNSQSSREWIQAIVMIRQDGTVDPHLEFLNRAMMNRDLNDVFLEAVRQWRFSPSPPDYKPTETRNGVESGMIGLLFTKDLDTRDAVVQLLR